MFLLLFCFGNILELAGATVVVLRVPEIHSAMSLQKKKEFVVTTFMLEVSPFSIIALKDRSVSAISR